jgi:hypothetical protein
VPISLQTVNVVLGISVMGVSVWRRTSGEMGCEHTDRSFCNWYNACVRRQNIHGYFGNFKI